MSNSEVEVVDAVAVPDLAPTPASASQITAEDIAIPTLYMGQKSQTIVDAGLAKLGDIYASQGQSDSEAEILFDASADGDGVLIVPLLFWKSWSWSSGPGMPLEIWRFEDRGRPYPDGPPIGNSDPKANAYIVYNYYVAAPEVDANMPFKTRFYRSGSPAAQKINAVVARDNASPMHVHGFRWTTKETVKQGVGKYVIPQIKSVDLTSDQLKIASHLFELLAPGFYAQRASEASAPAVPSI